MIGIIGILKFASADKELFVKAFIPLEIPVFRGVALRAFKRLKIRRPECGTSDDVAQGLKEQNIDFDLKAVACDGIEECRTALLKKSRNVLDGNFIEGMACVGGCIGGAGCLTHGIKDKAEVDKYGREAFEKTITDAISVLK